MEKMFFNSVNQQNYKLKNIGKINKYYFENNKVNLEFTDFYGEISFYENDIVRLNFGRDKAKLTGHITPAVIQKNIEFQPIVKEEEGKLIITFEDYNIRLNTEKFSIVILKGDNEIFKTKDGIFTDSESGTYIFADYDVNEKIYGLGEKAGPLDKRGERIQMWNTDDPNVHSQRINELYQSHPIFISKREDSIYGLFLDNPGRTIFDFKELGVDFQNEKERYYIQTCHGNLDLYMYLGDTVKDVVKKHTYLIGPSYLPPKWAMGYQQASWKYKHESEILNVVKTYKEKNIPLDVIYLDITYMDGYRVFTFDKENFGNIKEIIREINEMGVKVVTIVDPGIKQDGKYHIFKDAVEKEMLCYYEDGRIFIGPVWPGDSVFPDFTEEKVREWWGDKHRFYLENGVSGIWNDMNEPAVFAPDKAITMPDDVIFTNDGKEGKHVELHNIYGMSMSRATYLGLQKLEPNKRPFVVGRAGYPGVQRYAAVWTGDNSSLWEHLEMSMSMCMSLSLSGISFCGPDAGGFGYDATGELMARWFQVGAFTPFFRNHYTFFSKDQEPWNFEKEYEDVMKKYVELRYTFLPYIYQQFINHVENYDPIVRPLLYNYPNDKKVENLNDQFLFGDDLLVAPVINPGKGAREVYLPEGEWVDYWTNEVFSGNKFILKEAPIDILPLYIRANSVIPHGNIIGSTASDSEELILNIYMTEDSSIRYVYHEDDGISSNGQVCKIEMDITKNNNEINVEFVDIKGDYIPTWNKLVIKNVIKNNCEIKVTGSNKIDSLFTIQF